MTETEIRLRLTKYSATENDFLLGKSTDIPSGIPREALAKALCHRLRGFGADGLLLLKEACGSADWIWEFYNADGSGADMCGNAARCATLWAKARSPSRSEFAFQTIAGIVQGRVLGNGLLEVAMPLVQIDVPVRAIELEGVRFRLVQSGVPHAVGIVWDDPNPALLRPLAQMARSHPVWGPKGANVTFVRPLGGQVLRTLTFERGVEDFTRSCGTGAVAAAFICQSDLSPTEMQRWEVHIPGGRVQVDLRNQHPQLIGEAHKVGDVEFDPDHFMKESQP